MNKVRGAAKRALKTPGYHVKPKYDLKHTRYLLESRKHKKGFGLMLAPMVDLFSVLVIYLIMNFSSTGEVFFISKDIKIPEASQGMPMESYPLVSVLGDKVAFDALLDNSTVAFEDVNDGRSPKLRERLKVIRERDIKILGPDGFKGQINIQADQSIPVEKVKRVMQVLIDEGWTTLNLILEPNKNISY